MSKFMSKKYCSELLTRKMSSNQGSDYVPVKKEASQVKSPLTRASTMKSPSLTGSTLKSPPATASPMIAPHVKSPPAIALPMIAPPVKSPYNYEAILRDADPPISVSSVNLFEQLRSGVFLKPTKQIKYWVDERNNNCFMLFAKNLSITWSDDPNYWNWFTDRESPNETFVEAVELKNVCWLDITGKFDTRNLTPGIVYEVVFKVKLEDPAYGWDTPVNLKLVLPNGKEKPQEQKLSLRELPRYRWVDIRIGEFVPAGEITFSMYEHEAGLWKKGLFIKGVVIRPKH